MRQYLIVGGGAAPSLVNDETLTLTDGATIPSTLTAALGIITCLCDIAAEIFVVTHGNTSTAGNFVDEMVARKDELNKAMARDACRVVADRFYWIFLRPSDAPKLGLISPRTHGGENLVSTPLTLTTG